MRTLIFFKTLLLLPSIVFFDFIIMVLLGCLTWLLGFGDNFYCGLYCLIGKGILLLSALIFIYLLSKYFIKIRYHIQYAETNQKSQNS
jgi:hypothetical protein